MEIKQKIIGYCFAKLLILRPPGSLLDNKLSKLIEKHRRYLADEQQVKQLKEKMTEALSSAVLDTAKNLTL